MTQIERIVKMEAILDRAVEANKRLAEALEEYLDVQNDITELAEYYFSEQWLQDFDDDNDNKLPKDLKRGVLSEDAVYHMLADNKDTAVDVLLKTAELMKKKDI